MELTINKTASFKLRRRRKSKKKKKPPALITIANTLSLLRILLIPIIVNAILSNNIKMGLILYIIALSTDLLDGFFARKLKQESKYGMVIDASADFFLVICLWVVFCSIFSLSILIIIVTILYFAQFLISVKIGKMRYDIIGKYYGCWHMLIFFLGFIAMSKIFFEFAIIASIIYTIIAFFSRYGKKFAELLKKTNC